MTSYTNIYLCIFIVLLSYIFFKEEWVNLKLSKIKVTQIEKYCKRYRERNKEKLRKTEKEEETWKEIWKMFELDRIRARQHRERQKKWKTKVNFLSLFRKHRNHRLHLHLRMWAKIHWSKVMKVSSVLISRCIKV